MMDTENKQDFGQTYTVNVTVSEPTRIGDGLNAYVRYKVSTTTDDPRFGEGKNFTVYRRYNEFYLLYSFLKYKYMPMGFVVTKLPEKSIKKMAKVKISDNPDHFENLEERMLRLQNFMQRILSHPQIHTDSQLMQFLKDDDWSRLIKLTAPQKTIINRISKNVSEVFKDLSLGFELVDHWFEDEFSKFEKLYNNLSQVKKVINDLYHVRQNLARECDSLSHMIINICFAESHTSMARVFNKLSGVKEKTAKLIKDLSYTEMQHLVASIKDILGWIASINDVFKEALTIITNIDHMKIQVQQKKELLRRDENRIPFEKLARLQAQIEDLESTISLSEKNLEKMLQNLRSEIDYFDSFRINDTKHHILEYARRAHEIEKKIEESWETLLPLIQEVEI